jgi:hypothetical protein
MSVVFGIGLTCSCVVPERQYSPDAATSDAAPASDTATRDAAVRTDAASGGPADATTTGDASQDASPRADAQVADASQTDAFTPDVGGQGPDSGDASPADASPNGDAAPTCSPTAVEDCFNALDDDCNGTTDCADPACTTGATCVPAGEVQGVTVAVDEACPPGYEADEQILYQGLTGEPCSGCRCDAQATVCSGAAVYFYMNEGDCAADTTLTGGSYMGDVTGACPASPTPIYYGWGEGYRVGPISVLSGTGICSPSGTPSLGAVSWATSTKFCAASNAGTGCQAGYACVPEPTSGIVCSETLTTCPTGISEQVWYEDYQDGRACEACSCTGAGDCAGVQVQLGSDWSCGSYHPPLGGGQQDCAQTPYSPPAELIGAPTDPVCAASSDTRGDLTAVRPHTLCCSR